MTLCSSWFTLRLDLKFEGESSFVGSAAVVALLNARAVSADAARLRCGAARCRAGHAHSPHLLAYLLPYALFDNFLACTRRLPAAPCDDATHRKHAVRRLALRSAV